MSSQDSVAYWINSLRSGTQPNEAAEQLYHRYVERLKALARQKLAAASRRVADEEDIANIVLADAFEGIAQDRFHQLEDREDLWQVLLMLTDRRVTDQRRRQGSRKRGSGRVRGESGFFDGNDSQTSPRGIEQITAREPSPAFAAMFTEEFETRMSQLPDSTLQQLALAKMQGKTNAEISQEQGCTTRTIERKLSQIRDIWQQS